MTCIPLSPVYYDMRTSKCGNGGRNARLPSDGKEIGAMTHRYKLTTRKVEALTAPGTFSDGGGLYLVVGPNSKSWIFRYQLRGRRRDMGLGSVRWVTLAEARDLAYQAHRVLTLERADPLDKRRASEAVAAKETKLATFTFAHCTLETLKNKRPGWSPGHAANWEASMQKYVLPVLGKLRVADIKAEAAANILKPLRLKHPKLAADLQTRIEAVFKTAIGNDWCSGEILIKLKYIMDLLPAAAEAKSHEALDWRDMPKFMAALRPAETIGASALELLILCGLRLNEVRPAKWNEFNLEERMWTIPAERMKGATGKRKPHDVPLSSAALAVLNRMADIRVGDFVFGGTAGAISESTMTRELKQLRRDVTLHGFRTTFSTWLNRKGFPSEMVEHALAHKVGTKVKRIYDKETMIEARREMMEVWADYCAGIEPATNVVPLRA